jgi:hypothetical protein
MAHDVTVGGRIMTTDYSAVPGPATSFPSGMIIAFVAELSCLVYYGLMTP